MAVSDSAGLQTSGTTDPRDKNILLGVDADGLHHVYQTHVEQIKVIDGSEVVADRNVVGFHVDDWMHTVAQQVGWERTNYTTTPWEDLAETIDAIGVGQ